MCIVVSFLRLLTRRWLQFAWLMLLLWPAQVSANLNAEQIEFFEKEIRPLFVSKCYSCHSAQLPAPMGGLRLDTAEGVVKGGDSGPLIVPGEPEKSLLIKAVSYKDLQLKMPPTGKLTDEEIQRLITWVKMGAPDPRNEVASATAPTSRIDFEKARTFWAFRKIQKPVVPVVEQNSWVSSPIDSFVLAQLQSKGLKPAPPADKHAWLRRVTFDLIGLPPTPREIEAYLADNSALAQDRVVDRLLASPHYGERWARHWLDLVRFAETNGHEFDNDKLDAWRYRDYVIRALNQDVPYDQFVKEHIAGDLLPQKRLSADGTCWESPLATGFLWFGEVLNSATDSVKSRADEVDNQIDVLTKAFLGLTGACSRCHDHKFDPIPTTDYYALAGFLHSTNVSEAILDSPPVANRIAEARTSIGGLNLRIERLMRGELLHQAGLVDAYLLAASEVLAKKPEERERAIFAMASKRGLAGALLSSWAARIEAAQKQPESLFYAYARVLEQIHKGESFETAWTQIRLETSKPAEVPAGGERRDVIFEEFESRGFPNWKAEGQAFGDGPVHRLPPNEPLRDYVGQGVANSFGVSNRMVGSLTSRKFKLPKLFVHVLMGGSREDLKGEKARLRFTVVADGHKSLHLFPKGESGLQWMTLRLTKEIGRQGYFEIVDRSTTGHIVVDQIVLSDSQEPPRTFRPPVAGIQPLVSQQGIQSLEELARTYRQFFQNTLQKNQGVSPIVATLSPTGRLEDLAANQLLPGGRSLSLQASHTAQSEVRKFAWLPDSGSRAGTSQKITLEQITQLQAMREQIERRIPESIFGMIGSDEEPHDVQVHIRGNHKNLGEVAPRRFLQVIAGDKQPPVIEGSGRLQLAEWMVHRENPLTPRVMVNRIWKHHFGQGIVRSVDNFGKTGEPPTHPELLDFLAQKFIDSGWSIKAMHRIMVLSSTYAMSSQADLKAEELDPENKWLHRMPMQRLEGESIRDAILAVSGRLDPKVLGPAIPPHISAYQDGRGKPESGPLDGNGRRSIYIQVRRNFLTPIFLAFDYPLPISAIGRRSVSTVPSQALMLMNNEFVVQQAEAWAHRSLEVETDPERGVRNMFLTAFGRPAQDQEVQETLEFLQAQAQRHAKLQPALSEVQLKERVWADVAHVLFNSAEFVYIR